MMDLIIKKETMEKTIKMSLETAQIIYKQTKRDSNSTNFMLYTWLMENFTKEELEGKKGFTWEDGYNGGGYVLNHSGIVVPISEIKSLISEYKNVFKTEAQAKSALAFAQLSHIVAKYNEGKKPLCKYLVYYSFSGGFSVTEIDYTAIHLFFYKKEDAELSMEVNRQLWLDYWMIESVKATVIETSR